MMQKKYWLLLLFLASALCILAQNKTFSDGGLIELKTDTLPGLSIARSGHTTLCLDGTLTVLGGHTAGFVPTPTAEYFRHGAWHTISLAYPHDAATALRLRSGKVLLAGGHKEELGIGQLFSVEMYDPATHTSRGFGCMDRKRAFASAIEMNDGQVVIAGNWYADDGIETFPNVYDPTCTNAVREKDVSFARATPYLLRITDDEAILFGSYNNKGKPADAAKVDRLKGAPYREPFLETWSPLHTIYVYRSANHFIGHAAEHRYEWLLPVEHVKTGRVALARVKGPAPQADGKPATDEKPTFSLLPTQPALPDSLGGRRITYSSFVCDRARGLAYLIGDDEEARIYVVSIPYNAATPAPLTIYVTPPQPFIAQSVTPVLTPEGDLVFAGGHLVSNFAPSAAVVRLPLGESASQNKTVCDGAVVSEAEKSHSRWWIWMLIACLAICAFAICYKRPRKKHTAPNEKAPQTLETPSAEAEKQSLTPHADLFNRIVRLMEEEKLYLNPNLRASDVAARAGSNTAYVSAAINSQRGCSFSQFLTAYRIAHAQELMRKDTEIKIAALATLSGFTTDSTFFRAFRTVTGMSPKEWLEAYQNGQAL